VRNRRQSIEQLQGKNPQNKNLLVILEGFDIIEFMTHREFEAPTSKYIGFLAGQLPQNIDVLERACGEATVKEVLRRIENHDPLSEKEAMIARAAGYQDDTESTGLL
jgi:hypothetical protein